MSENGPWDNILDAPEHIYLIGRERRVVFFRDGADISYIDRVPTSAEFANEHGPFVRLEDCDLPD